MSGFEVLSDRTGDGDAYHKFYTAENTQEGQKDPG